MPQETPASAQLNQTEELASEREARQRAEAMFAQLNTVLERITDAFYALDTEWRFTYLNTEAERLLARSRDELLGTCVWNEFPEAIDSPIYHNYLRAAREHSTVDFQVLYTPLNAWFEIRAYPSDEGLSVFFRDISERKAIQDRLRHSEERYRSLVETTAAIVWNTSPNGDIINELPGWSAFTGQSYAELKGLGWLNAVHPEDQAHTAQSWAMALSQRSLYQTEHRLRRYDGSYRYMLVRAVPVLELDGSVREWIGSHTDITDLKQTQEQLRSLEERYRVLAEVIPVQVWTSLPNGELDYVSRRTAEYFALHPDDLLGQGWTSVLHPDDLDVTRQKWLSALQSGTPYEVEFRLRNGHDGSYRWHVGRALPLRDSSGQIIRWFGTNTDIQHQKRAKQAEAALRQNERWLAITLKSIGDAVITTDASGCVTFINTVAESLTGWMAHDAIGQSLEAILPLIDEHTLAEVERPLLHVIHSGQVIEQSQGLLACHRSGRRFPIVSSSAPIRDDVGAIVGVAVVFRDMTERVRTEQRLRFMGELSQMLSSSLDYARQLSQLTQLAVPQMADLCAVHVVEPDGTISRLAFAAIDHVLELIDSEAATYMIVPSEEYGPARVIKTAQTEFYNQISPELYSRLQRDQRDTILVTGLTSWICVPLILHRGVLGSLTFGRTGSIWQYSEDDVAFAEEIARRTALAVDNALLYHEARQAIETRDAFLSVAAHELKTPLTSLLGYTELFQHRIRQSNALQEREQRMLDVITDQARRLNKMVLSLFDLSRLHMGQLSLDQRELDLSALALRIVKEIEPTLQQHTLHTQIADRLMVLGDELRLEQVLTNLIHNAIKYSPQGGPIFVRASRDDERVRVSVRDHGLGIPAEALPHIFHRFYRADNTTPLKIGGMGVGLYVTKQIVELHKGQIEVESVEGRGSIFTLWLPEYRAF
jgi:PAS domain S-box-containing protein